MVDTCAIASPGAGEPTLDEDTGQLVYPDVTPVYSGPCRARAPRAEERTVEAAEQWATLQELVISLPVDGSEGVLVGQVVTYGLSRDPALTGRTFTVVGLHLQTDSTARRLLCRTRTGGA